jgi:uncharacterized protein
MSLIVNYIARRLESMFPGYFPEAKHNHYRDFGFPKTLDFNAFHAIYSRNGIAAAGVDKTKAKTWQDNPAIWESENPDETPMEAELRQWADDLRLWQRLADADRRSMVGEYAGVILRLADSKRFQEPVDRVPGGLAGLVEIIPVWQGQLRVSSWSTDEQSPDYGKPTMFQFNEAQVDPDVTRTRSFDVHPDRVIVWSADGTVHGTSLLEPGYNDLLTMEKIVGAGGEGFWKTAKGGLALQVDKEARLQDMADAMGVPADQVAQAMDDQIAAFNKGFDKLLMLQGMEAKALPITLPDPDPFFNVALQGFAASVGIPLKVLVGNQTGERASTEDARDWAQHCMGRRVNVVRPNIMGMINRLERFRILPERDWHLHWTDLTESSVAEKVERAGKMADINQKMGGAMGGGERVFTPDEIRGVIDMEPLAETEGEDEL